MPYIRSQVLSIHSFKSRDMDKCKFKTVNGRCSRAVVGWDFCEEHENLRKKTHAFYKQVESQRNKVNQEQSDEEIFQQRHQILLLTVAGREAHREMFFSDEPCENHSQHASSLNHERKKEEEFMCELGKGFIIQGAAYDNMLRTATDSLKQAFLDWNDSDKSQEIETFIRDFPRAIASGTEVPEAVVERMKPPKNIHW
ncbi:hypothetical protein F4678DRAFT_459263 [Xylaria arbuscula]|nr:hypothetical protein F4678DRAFT_459263 [Xylaria arbuscula]